jgi:anti-sigma factor RsiW
VTAPGCDRIGFAQLTDYASGELSGAEIAALEEHLFACVDCGARAAEFDTIVRAVPPAVRSADVGGFVTDAVLNRLEREGVRLRTYALSPGAVLPCAVWADDEVMVLRLRGDFGSASEFTLSERVAGAELARVTGQVTPSPQGEVIFAMPASSIRHLAVVNVEVLLTAVDAGDERTVGSYTLIHGGSLQR